MVPLEGVTPGPADLPLHSWERAEAAWKRQQKEALAAEEAAEAEAEKRRLARRRRQPLKWADRPEVSPRQAAALLAEQLEEESDDADPEAEADDAEDEEPEDTITTPPLMRLPVKKLGQKKMRRPPATPPPADEEDDDVLVPQPHMLDGLTEAAMRDPARAAAKAAAKSAAKAATTASPPATTTSTPKNPAKTSARASPKAASKAAAPRAGAKVAQGGAADTSKAVAKSSPTVTRIRRQHGPYDPDAHTMTMHDLPHMQPDRPDRPQRPERTRAVVDATEAAYEPTDSDEALNDQSLEEARHKRQNNPPAGPVHSFIKTDKHGFYKWGVRHYVMGPNSQNGGF